MKLLKTLVSSNGFREIPHNPVRWQALSDLLKVAKDRVVDLVLLPGGYFAAADDSEMCRIFEAAAHLARAAGTTLVLGVDLPAGT